MSLSSGSNTTSLRATIHTWGCAPAGTLQPTNNQRTAKKPRSRNTDPLSSKPTGMHGQRVCPSKALGVRRGHFAGRPAGVPPVIAATPLPPPRPREKGTGPSPPPAPISPVPAQPPPAPSPPDEECLASLQKLGFEAEAASPPPAPEPECVIDKPVRLRSLRLSTGAPRDVTFPDAPIVACRFAERFGRWVGDLAAVLVRGQLGTDLKAVRTGVGFE